MKSLTCSQVHLPQAWVLLTLPHLMWQVRLHRVPELLLCCLTNTNIPEKTLACPQERGRAAPSIRPPWNLLRGCCLIILETGPCHEVIQIFLRLRKLWIPPLAAGAWTVGKKPRTCRMVGNLSLPLSLQDPHRLLHQQDTRHPYHPLRLPGDLHWRARCSPSPPLQWSTTPRDSSPTPPSCRAATAVGFRPSAGAARPKPQVLKIRWTTRRRGRAWATAARRSRCAKRARRRPRTACTSGLCGARCRYLTASPSRSRPSRPRCPPSPWRRDRATWRMGPGGRTPARGPGPCPGRSRSCKALFDFPAVTPWPFTSSETYGEKTFSVGTLITYSDLSFNEWN